jgi:hypothetical protein
METITLDFELRMYSYEYGRFLTMCYEGYPHVVVSNGSPHFWNYYNPNHQIVTVDVPHELAIVLKLAFGNCLKIRPTEEELQRFRHEAKIKDDTDSMYYTHFGMNKKIKNEYGIIKLYEEIKQIANFKIIKPR